MRYILIFLVLISFYSFGQVPGDSSLAPSSITRLNDFYTGSWIATGTNTYAATIAKVKLKNGKTYSIKFTNANSGTSSFNLNSGGATPLKKYNSSGSLVNLVTGDIWANQTSSWTFDGTNLVLQAPSSQSSGITNSAGNNVLMKSDGTNAISSGLIMTGTIMTGLTELNGGIMVRGLSGATRSRFLEAEANSGTGNDVLYPLRLGAISTVTPATGKGTGLELQTQTASSTFKVGATIQSVSTDITSSSEDFDLVFKNMTAGAAATEKFRFSSLGGFGVGGANYGSSGNVLTSNGSSAAPSWQAASAGTVTSVASADGSITVTNPTSTVDLSVVKAPIWSTARNLAGNSVNGSANVAFSNKFIVQGTTDAGLSGAQFLGSLGTGLVKNTTSTGVFSIASSGTDYALPLTSGNGTTANGTAIDLGGTLTGDINIEDNSIGTNSINIGQTTPIASFNASVSAGQINFIETTNATGMQIGDGFINIGDLNNNITTGINAFTLGSLVTTLADYSFAGGRGFNSSKAVTSSGRASFNWSENTTAQTSGHGALAANSAIFGGIDENIPSTAIGSTITASNAGKVSASVLYTLHSDNLRIKNIAYFGNFTTAPTAKIHIAAGTASASTAPLKFTSGTLLTTAEAGAEEFLTDKFYGTITTGAARKEFTLNDAALTSGRVPFATTNGRIIDNANMVNTPGTGILIADNLKLTTAGNKIFITEGTNGSVGQATLVSGTKAITISGVSTSSRCTATFVSIGGTVTTTWQYGCVCTSNTVTITALTNANTTNTSDTSILNYLIIN